LLVASTGGHLDELRRLSRRFEPESTGVEWATFDDEQSRSLLAGERVHTVEFVPPRGYGAAARNLRLARRILRQGQFRRVVTTGAGVAIPFLASARLLGIDCHYIESAARSLEPSLTGRVAGRIPGVHLYTQYLRWAGERWAYAGSLFDGYVPEPVTSPPTSASRIVVTLGTMRTYGFRRAVDAVLAVLPDVAPNAEILWQTGFTDVSDLPIHGRQLVPANELCEAVAAADLVIAHAGIGSALAALDQGKCPVILPRRAEHHEHVDDHQELIARELDGRGLAVHRDAGSLAAPTSSRPWARPSGVTTTAKIPIVSSAECFAAAALRAPANCRHGDHEM